MKIKDMTLEQWQERIDQFKREKPDAKREAVFRIDGTQFSVARFYGRFTYNGDTYTVFYFKDGAMIGVRSDFLRWLEKKLKTEAFKEVAK